VIHALAVVVRCPSCRRFWGEVPKGTPYRAYCLGCGLKWETKA
jgi:hypothetical protein